MSEIPDFERELQTLLDSKTAPSASKIGILTKLALKYQKVSSLLIISPDDLLDSSTSISSILWRDLRPNAMWN
jgi:hypothetical protein